jgi:hypothetical protein
MPHLHFRYHADWRPRIIDDKGYVTVYLVGLHLVHDLPAKSSARGLRLILGPLELGVSWGLR